MFIHRQWHINRGHCPGFIDIGPSYLACGNADACRDQCTRYHRRDYEHSSCCWCAWRDE
jgi:hypothetical protein